jgi:hypothetical protein
MEGHEFDQKTAEACAGECDRTHAQPRLRQVDPAARARDPAAQADGFHGGACVARAEATSTLGAASVGGLVRLFGLVGLLRPFNEVNKFVC